MVQIILSNPVCVAGFLAGFLDNTIPGMPNSLHGQVVVPSERTLHEWILQVIVWCIIVTLHQLCTKNISV